MAQVTVKFDSYNESDDIEDYLERLELFLTANIVEDEKRVGHLIWAKAYAVVKNLTAPRIPKECNWDRLKELLINHFMSNSLCCTRFVRPDTQSHTR